MPTHHHDPVSNSNGFWVKLTRLFMCRTSCDDLHADEAFINHIKWRQQLLARGEPARAIVRNLSDKGTLVNFNRIVTLELDVHADGHPAWRVAVTTPMSKLALPEVNEVIEVRYDPNNPQDVALV